MPMSPSLPLDEDFFSPKFHARAELGFLFCFLLFFFFCCFLLFAFLLKNEGTSMRTRRTNSIDVTNFSPIDQSHYSSLYTLLFRSITDVFLNN
jgi:hypothetical protein